MKIEKMAKFIALILFFGSSLNYGMSKPSGKAMPRLTKKDLENQLIHSARTGDIDDVKLLLEAGVNPNVQDKVGSTALMHAANKGFLDTVKVLLKYGALIGIKGKKGYDVIDMLETRFHAGRTGSWSNRRLRINAIDENLFPVLSYIVAEYADLTVETIYQPILELLEKTLKERIEKRNKRIKEILHERDFGIPVKDLQRMICEFAAENEETENSEENYSLEGGQKREEEQKDGSKFFGSLKSCVNCVIS